MSPRQGGNQHPLAPNVPNGGFVGFVPTAQLQQQPAGMQNVLAPAFVQAVNAQYQQALANQTGTQPDIAAMIGLALQANMANMANRNIQQQETTVDLRQTTECIYLNGSENISLGITIRNSSNSC